MRNLYHCERYGRQPGIQETRELVSFGISRFKSGPRRILLVGLMGGHNIDETERPDYLALMKQSTVYAATKNILEIKGALKEQFCNDQDCRLNLD